MSSHLVQLLLPVADNRGQAFPDSVLEDVKDALVAKFGGVTAFEMAPAQGIWAPEGTGKCRDEVVIVEVMVDTVDEQWWGQFREHLEKELRQDEIVVRAFLIRKL